MSPLFDGLAKFVSNLLGGDEQAMTPLGEAARKGDVDAVKSLLDSGADIEKGYLESTPLLLALHYDQPAIARLLIERGANVKAKSSVFDCLGYAASARNAELVKMMMDRGASYEMPDNEYGETRLHQSGGAATFLPIGIGVKDVNAKDKHGNTPLHGRTDRDDYEALIKHGADVHAVVQLNATVFGGWLTKTMVNEPHTKEWNSGIERLEYLLANGVDINETNPDGWTAMHQAAFKGSQPMVEWLLTKGAKKNEKNSDGQTPLALAGALLETRKETRAFYDWLKANGFEM